MLEKVWPWWSELLSHPSRDQFWQDLSVLDQAGQVTVPALHIGGWFDIFAANTARSFTELRSRAGSAEAREGQRLIIGPWDHLNSTATDTYLYDPLRPVPTLGGRIMLPTTANAAGAVDQRPAEAGTTSCASPARS